MCYFGNVGETLPNPVAEGKGTEVECPRKCLHADLVVVEDLARLHDYSESANVKNMLAIVARGLPVVTLASWGLAEGDPALVPPQSIIRHRPLAMGTNHVWEYDAMLQAREANLAYVIGELCKEAPPCNWIWREPGAAKAGSAAERVPALINWCK